MFWRTLAAACMVATIPQVAFAQDAQLPPLLKDLQPGYDMADGTVLDLLGIELGMNANAALAAQRAAHPDGDIVPSDQAIKVTDYRGNDFVFRYHERDALSWRNDAGTAGNLDVAYATGVTGGRVVAVNRDERYADAEQPSVGDVMSALEKKYGKPSYVLHNQGLIQIFYAWFKGKPSVVNEAQYQTERQFDYEKPTPVKCFEIQNYGGYSFMTDRKDDYPDCSVALVVQMNLGRRDDLVSRLNMYLTDYRRWYDDSIAADAYALDAFSSAVNSGSSASAPAM